MKVVIADDNPDILETTEMALALDGHTAIRAQAASGIIDAVQQADLLMQDINMPGLDLAVLLDRLLAARGVPVVVFSGHAPSEEVLAHPLVVGYLPKPFDLAQLREILQRVSEGL